MQRRTPGRPGAARVANMIQRALALVAAVAAVAALLLSPAAAQEAGLDFSPASGHARVIAQGVVPLPAGDAVWRTVRTRAPLPANAAFEARPLGFVMATTGPLLLARQESGEQTHLGAGEAALMREGMVLVASLADQPVSYLSIELVAADAPAPPASATVLQPGQPFPAPASLHDLDLLVDTLAADEVFTIPDSGAKNVVLITEGAAAVGRPGSDPVVLLAGEAASFSGELQVSAAPDGASGAPATTFAVAMIGPELPPLAVPAPATVTAEATGVAAQETATPKTTEVAQAETGSITVEIFTCPAGMTPETLNAAACAPATDVFDVTVSGGDLAAPLTIADATASASAYTWDGLLFGDYVVAEAVLPRGYASYVLSARETTGDPATGYRISIDADTPHLAARIYNFAAE